MSIFLHRKLIWLNREFLGTFRSMTLSKICDNISHLIQRHIKEDYILEWLLGFGILGVYSLSSHVSDI